MLYHYHKYIELLYFLEGGLNVYINDECMQVTKGDIFIVYANEPHAFEHTYNNKYIVIKFLPEILRTKDQTIKEFEYIFNFSMQTHSRIIKDTHETLRGLFADAYEQFMSDNYSGGLFVRADLFRICAEIIGKWHDNGEIVSISSVTGHENLILLQKVMDIAKETNGAVKTHEAAKMCGMSDGHFSRVFRSLMNMTFMRYIKNIKTEEAERLLKCTDTSVTDIAQILNYASTSHFIEDFKKEKGLSPKQYKKTILGQ